MAKKARALSLERVFAAFMTLGIPVGGLVCLFAGGLFLLDAAAGLHRWSPRTRVCCAP